MAVPAVNIVIDKGTDFSTNFKLKRDGAPIDLTGYTVTSKMRRHHSSSTSYNFIVTSLIPYSNGVIRVGMASSITATIPTGRYVYDVLLSASGTTTNVRHIIKGIVRAASNSRLDMLGFSSSNSFTVFSSSYIKVTCLGTNTSLGNIA